MKKKIRGKFSYASVMATIAVFLVLGGGAALAAGSFTGKQKKQVGKIATKVFNARIGGATVSHAGSADTATKATTATKANEATKAITAAKATEATKATTATKAADSEKFGGRVPAEYQRKLKEGCAPPTSIAGLSNEGDVTCTTPVTAIIATPAEQEVKAVELGNGLQLLTVCHDGGTQMSFQNVGGSPSANLNWFYSTGSDAIASGASDCRRGRRRKCLLLPGRSHRGPVHLVDRRRRDDGQPPRLRWRHVLRSARDGGDRQRLDVFERPRSGGASRCRQFVEAGGGGDPA